MRDIALIVMFVACIPFAIRMPAVGVVVWIWLSVMNPHRLTYGFAYDLPFAAVAAAVTLIALVITKDERRLPMTAPVIALGLFTMWMCITSLVPIHPGSGYPMWSRVMKIMLMTFVAFAAIQNRKQIHWVVWIICFSLGFYGVKGGFFTLVSGGSFLVWGPGGSFIEGNNELALALVTVIPLMRYVQLQLKNPWARRAMFGAMGLCALAAIGSHSRGALLAIAAMAGFLWLKSRNKFGMGIVLVVAALAMLSFMPAEWTARMNTIKTYDEDDSALGRINAWWMAFNLAKANFFGGGYEIYDAVTFGRYAPNPIDIHAAHSIYFQILGEHGFVGLFLFLSVGAFTWMTATNAKRKTRGRPDLLWAAQLMDMAKVSMIGFGVGGAFLSLAYFDVPYYVAVIVVATREFVTRAIATPLPAAAPVVARRRDRFGVVPVQGSAATFDQAPEPATGRRSDWRSQQQFGSQSLAPEGDRAS